MSIQLSEVTKQYKMGGELLYALASFDLEIKDGEFVAIIGPSGSGKSTLANIIGGLDVPSSGTVVVNGRDLSAVRDSALSHYRNKEVGFVFQTFNLQAHNTALENVMLPLVFAKMPLGKRRARALACLEAVGLADRVKHKPAQLSGGQRQRVSIARALANEPSIIIADEPTGNLDTKRSEEIIDLLQKLHTSQKLTLIIITHDPVIAKQADRIIRIQDGKIKRSR